MAAGGAAACLRQEASVSVPFTESEFDPSELLGSLIPFVDPFGFDDGVFQAAAPSSPTRPLIAPPLLNFHSGLSMLTSPILAYPEFQGHFREALPLPQPVLQPVAIRAALDTRPQPPVVAVRIHALTQRPVVPARINARTKLNPDQAIYIFKQRSTKTIRTAVRLSAEYGITPKAVRDIWTRRSWVRETRPYWT